MSQNLQKLFDKHAIWFAQNSADSAEAAVGNQEKGGLPSAPQPYSLLRKATNSPASDSNTVVPFYIKEIDDSLAEKGLSFAAVHELFLSERFSSTSGTSDNLSAEHNSYNHARQKHSDVHAHLLASLLITNAVRTLLQQSSTPQSTSTHFSKLILWISVSSFPAPFFLLNSFHDLQRSFKLRHNLIDQCIFLKVHSTKELLWTIDTALTSAATSMLVAELPTIPFAQERRFAVRAKSQGVFTLFLRKNTALKRNAAAQTRWSLAPYHLVNSTSSAESIFPGFELSLLTKKGTQPAQRRWQLELNDSSDIFCLSAPQHMQASRAASDSPEMATDEQVIEERAVEKKHFGGYS